MAIVTSTLDLILRRLRKWHHDDYADNILIPRDDVKTLLEGIDELKQAVRDAPCPQVGTDVVAVLDAWGQNHHHGKFIRIEPASEETAEPKK